MAYSRVNWENGTKVSDAYVEIDGTQHTVIPAVYSGRTPTNATSLNIMDKGIKSNSDKLNGNTPMGSIIVEDITCKNLFDINGEVNVQANNGAIVSRNTVSNNILTANANMNSVYPSGQKITGLTGKTVTFSAKITSTGTGQDGRIYIYDGYVQKRAVAGTSGETISITYTCESDNILFVFGTGSGTGAQFTDIQVEKGEVATSYVEHKDFGYETGSNSNGNWIKYDDGTMICTKHVSFSNVTFSYSQGSLFFCANQTIGTMPQTFARVDSVIANVTSGNALHFGIKNTTTTTVGNIQFVRGDNTTQTAITMDVTIIGRWK